MKRSCELCGKKVNPVKVLLGPVCGECTLKNHQCFTLYRRMMSFRRDRVPSSTPI